MASDAPITLGRAPQWTLHPAPEPASPNFIGAVFGDRYLVRRRIGAGGMSTVYAAQDTKLGARVVIKILRDDLPSDPVDRFRREAHILAGLCHEHIARIIDRCDPDTGPRYLVTDYIDGHDLAELSARGKMPAAVVVQVGLQIAAALAHAHEVGVIHRDIKPSNVMLTRHPSGDIFIKVIDFGIAKLMRDSDLAAPETAPAGARRATRDNVVLGTAPFWCGDEGPGADVYALAMTLAVLLTGKVPMVGEQPQLDDPAIPRKLASTLRTALALDGKIATMNALDAGLREALDLLDPKATESERRRYFAAVFAKTSAVAAAVDEPAPPPAPRFADRYILCDELGQGGMGLVRTAFDLEFRRRVALKTMLPRYAGRERLRARFRREARALAAIDHPGIPRVYEIGIRPEAYFTMEIVEGIRLDAEARIEPVRALTLAIDLAEILAAAHDAGVVHRDVKPSNILIGKGDRIRLLDFGMCLLLPRYHQRDLVFPATPPIDRYETGEQERIIGTPGYTAPEVLAGVGTSVRSDIYSVCAVLYRMLCGRPLMDPGSSSLLPVRRHEFPGHLVAVADLVRRGTAREPAERPRSMTDLVAELEALRGSLLGTSRRRTMIRAVATTALVSITAALIAVRLLATDNPTGTDREQPIVAAGIPKETSSQDAPSSGPLTAETTRPDAASSTKDIDPEHPGHSPSTPTDLKAAASDPKGRPPSRPPSIAEPMTESSITELLRTHRRGFADCAPRYHLLRLVVARGRATLMDVNGMPFSQDIPEHACLSDGMRRLKLPRTDSAAEYAVPLDLRAIPESPQ